ncbi:MAG TPA: Ig-like domain-containing protein, partial [Chthoniobacterales bacterium]|nr:Ig-like domain-containing protein [Chthoniobacterales bacterium]
MKTFLINARLSLATTLFASSLLFDASAATLTVINSSNSGPGSLRQAVADAQDGDTINFDLPLNDPGYDATAGRWSIRLTTRDANDPTPDPGTLIAIAKSITIAGPGGDKILVTCPSTFSTIGHSPRLFYVAPGKNVVISGLTLSRPNTAVDACGESRDSGSVALNDSANLTIRGCSIRDTVTLGCLSSWGGALRNVAASGPATLRVEDCAFRDNRGSDPDLVGDILNGDLGDSVFRNFFLATLVVTNSTFSDTAPAWRTTAIQSESTHIGGVNASLDGCEITGYQIALRTLGKSADNTSEFGSDFTVRNSTIAHNGIGFHRAGFGSHTASFRNTTFAYHTISAAESVSAFGGVRGSMLVENCTFHNNNCSLGPLVARRLTLKILNSTFSENSGTRGGALYLVDADAEIRNSTFAGNTSPISSSIAYGGENGNFDFPTQLTVVNSIFEHGNSPNIAPPPPFGTLNLISLGSNISDDNFDNRLNGPGDQPNTSPALGPLQDNGGPTKTIMPQPGSPAIGAGNVALAVDQNGNPLTTDQRGWARVVNNAIDIGAVQSNAEEPSFVVTTDSDTTDPTDQQTTLREAIAYAKFLGGTQTITFNNGSVSGASVNFHDGAPHTILLNGSELLISSGNVTIQGPGADRLTVDGNQASRVLEVGVGATVTIDGMTVAHGRVTLANVIVVTAVKYYLGGGILNSGILTIRNSVVSDNVNTEGGATGVSKLGGGIANIGGNLTIESSRIRNNLVTGQAPSRGGGIFSIDNITGLGGLSDGRLTIRRSEIGGNKCLANTVAQGGGIMHVGAANKLLVVDSAIVDNVTDSGNTSSGGGIYNSGNHTGAIVNTTIARNKTLGAGTDKIGGGIFQVGQGTLFVTNCTIALNEAQGGGGLWSESNVDGSGLFAANSIIAANSAPLGPDFNGVILSLGFNVVGNVQFVGSWGTAPGDILNVDPQLSPLGNYGGFTPTMVPLPGSPVIGAGSPALAVDADGYPLLTDQRGLARTINGSVDIGAVQAAATTLTGPATPPAYGHSLAVTASVANATGGFVDFYLNGALSPSASVPLLPDNTATASFPNLNAGGYNVTSVYRNAGNSPEGNSNAVSSSIAKADAHITVNGYNVDYSASPHSATGSATGANNESLGGLDLSGTTHTNAGNYSDTWTFTDVTGNYNDASGPVNNVIKP